MRDQASFPQVCSSFIHWVSALWLALGCLAYGQTYYPNHEIRLDDLPMLTAKTRDASDVLVTSLEIIFRDKEICCGKDSALEDSAQRADPKSFKDVGDRLRGRHLLSDGRPIMITAEVWPAAAGNSSSGSPISEIMEKRALLMQWNLHWYVVYGVTYGVIVGDDGTQSQTILKLWLQDARYSDERRNVSFDRQTDDWGKVQGLLILRSAPQ
ncbi:MAG: hypothetical protein WB523_23100 [Candidatus Sulfotelmatobacter sp.]